MSTFNFNAQNMKSKIFCHILVPLSIWLVLVLSFETLAVQKFVLFFNLSAVIVIFNIGNNLPQYANIIVLASVVLEIRGEGRQASMPLHLTCKQCVETAYG